SQLSERLVTCGIPLWRVAVFVRTLHPNVMGRRLLWRPDAEVEVTEAPFELLETEYFRDSPIARVYRTGAAIRRKLADPDCPEDFPVLADLRAEEVTDYLASPLIFTDGAIHAVTCTTRQPGGFTDAQLAGIEAVITPLARVAEIRALRRMGSTLLDTYVGHDAGERILAGRIRRGDIEEIHAAIWLSDMRGFTALADSLPPSVLIDLLNRYFDCQVPVILEHGAEVLKFMGDGLLAIFTIARRRDRGVRTRARCRAPGTGKCRDTFGCGHAGAAVRLGLACRGSPLRQYRQRQSTRFHLHWSSRQLCRPHRKADQPIGPRDPRLR